PPGLVILKTESPYDVCHQLARAFSMLGGNRDGLAEAELKCLVEAVEALTALALVGDQNGGTPSGADQPRECGIGGRHPLPGINHEQHQIGILQRLLSLPGHAGGDAARWSLLE